MKKISELPLAGAPTADDVYVLNQAGVTSRIVAGKQLKPLDVPRTSFSTLAAEADQVLINRTTLIITFPQTFRVWVRDTEIVTPVAQDVSLVPTDAAEVLVATTLGRLIIYTVGGIDYGKILNLSSAIAIPAGYQEFGWIKRTSALTTASGQISVVGTFPYQIDGIGARDFPHLATQSRLPHIAFVQDPTALGYVEISTTPDGAFTGGKITFASNFWAYTNELRSERITLGVAQEVSLVCTDIDGNLQSSSLGMLIMHKETKNIINLYWRDWQDAYLSAYTFLGVIKRSTASQKVAGDIQVIGHFPYRIDGVSPGQGEADVIMRNKEIEPSIFSSCMWAKNADNDQKQFQVLVATDLHGSIPTSANAAIVGNRYDSIDAVIDLGDFMYSDYSDDDDVYQDFLARINKNVFVALGNHDVGNTKVIANCGTNQEVYDRFIKPVKTKLGLADDNLNYYYYDYDVPVAPPLYQEFDIRVIVLYEWDDPNDVDPGDPTQYLIRRGDRVLSQAQIDWFCNVLDTTPAGYHVVILLHQAASTTMTVIPGTFSYTYGGIGTGQIRVQENPITDIVDAWINGAALNKSWEFIGDASYLADISVDITFAARGAGNFICYLGGHHHRDFVSYVTAYPDQKQILLNVSSGARLRNYTSDIRRSSGTKAHDCITILSFDTTNKQIKFIRVGATMTESMVERKYMTFTYA